MAKRTWTAEQEDFLRENYVAMTNEQLCAALGKPWWAIKGRVTKLKIKGRRKPEKYRMFTDAENDLLRKEYPKGDLGALRVTLGLKTMMNLYQKAKALGVARDPELAIETARALCKALSAEDKGKRFVKGQPSRNKGMKQTEYMTPEAIARTAATRFKPGGPSHNRKPIGFERVSKDGYVEIKVRDVSRNRNYVSKHRLVWEQHNGPVPEGMMVEFIDGDKSNITIDNLRCVTRAENAARNISAYHALPGDIKEIMKLNNQLKNALK